MPIFRKGDHAVNFAHIPRTGGRSIIREASKNGWKVDYGYGKNFFHQHVFFDEYDRSVQRIPSFAVVRDPFDRFVSACRFERMCESQDDVVSFIDDLSDIPEVEYRHFDPQHKFVGPDTMIFNYETDLELLYSHLRFAGLLGPKQEVEIYRPNESNFDVDRDEMKAELLQIRRWYIEDYKRFGYMESKQPKA